MVEINLLPWRSIQYAENKKRKRVFLIFVTICVIGLGICHSVFKLCAHTYEAKIANLQAELEVFTSQTKQAPVDSHLVMIKQTETNQAALSNFFKIVFQETQGRILWTALTSKNNFIVGEGDSDSWITLAGFVNRYNLKNKGMPMTILNTAKNTADGSIHFRVRCARSLLPFLNQIKNDE